MKRTSDPDRRGHLTLSLCMIVRNEEEHLARCLGSVSDQVDEIVVVDTGSRDKSVEIAQSFGARVFHHPWEDNFSKHRNQSLSYARGDWILKMDADEEVEAEDAPKIRELIKDPQTCSFFFPMIHISTSGGRRSQHNAICLFRNHLGFHFRGIVHNILVHGGPTRFAPVRVYHYGYGLSPEKMEAKFVRTSTLLKQQLAEDPENFLAHHYLGMAYLGRNDFLGAYEEGKAALEFIRKQGVNSEHVQETYYLVESAAFHLGRGGEAEFYALEALRRFPLHLDSHFFLFSLYWSQNRLAEFLSASARCLELLQLLEKDPGRLGTVGLFTERRPWKVHVFRAVAWSRLGDEEKSETEIRLAEESGGPDPECHRVLGGFLAERGQLERARTFFRRALLRNPEDSTARAALDRLDRVETASRSV